MIQFEIKTLFKKVCALLPLKWQTELKRIYFGIQIRKGVFITIEPEYALLHTLIKPGDWVIDIGANVGHYTNRFSELVGKDGRVIAFEPEPTSFSLLSANALHFAHCNVTLINAAASNIAGIVGLSMPTFPTGLKNYYEAHITPLNESNLSVLALPLDELNLTHSISLVKIDAEGHEASVLEGMKKLLETFRPTLIVETFSEEIITHLQILGYIPVKLTNSWNIIFQAKANG